MNESISNCDNHCIFCKIISGKLPASRVSEDDEYLAIRDVNPQAPVHILVIPKLHLPGVSEFEEPAQLGRLFQAASKVAASEKLSSFRLVINKGADAGQTIFHLHFHLIGGRKLRAMG